MNVEMINTQKLAREIEGKILKQFEADWATACKDEGASGLKALYISDAGDMLNICRLIGRGNMTEAGEALVSLDTAPREEIFSIIERTAGSEFADQMMNG
jgi:hypothetical protein